MTSPIRSTIRVNAHFFNQSGASSPPSGKIYYLKFSTPHIYDISFSGPFHNLEALVPSLRRKLVQTSPQGLQMFEEMFTSRQALSSFQHIEAPLDGGHKLLIELVERHNPQVAASLPGPAWNVWCAELLSLSANSGTPKLKSMDILDAYTSAEAANEAVRQMVAEKSRGMRGARKMVMPKDDGTTSGVVMNSSATWIVESALDSGVETFEDDS